MKIIKRSEFLKLPKNIVFSRYTPHVFGGLCIKDESLSNDFLYSSLSSDSVTCEESSDYFNNLSLAESGESVPLDFDILGRDGCFDEEEKVLFAVWEKEDIEEAIKKLNECLGG